MASIAFCQIITAKVSLEVLDIQSKYWKKIKSKWWNGNKCLWMFLLHPEGSKVENMDAEIKNHLYL